MVHPAELVHSLSKILMKYIFFKNELYSIEFQFSIKGYQFPDIESDYDGNWLNVKYECFYKDKQFVVVDPSLLTTELKAISEWFYKISNNEIPEYVSLSFIEPNLEFILYGNKNNLIRYGIKLDLEAKPPFDIDEFLVNSSEDEEDEESEFIMIFESYLGDLRKYSDQFRELCKQYPQRGDF